MEDTNIRFLPTKCPVCNGFGTVKHGQLTCSSCRGKGFIIIDQHTGTETGDTDNDFIHQNTQ
jgi:DnaJ-class molecular chaperone